MLREPQHKNIDGVDYVCRPLPGWEGIRLFFELVPLIGEPAMLMITRAFSEGDTPADAGEIVGAGVYSFFSKIETDTGVAVMRLVFSEIEVVDPSTKKASSLSNDAMFNQHFTGGILQALKVFAWGMQVNFQSFLEGSRLSGPIGGLMSAVGAAFSPQTSPKASTDSSAEAMERSA